MPPDALDAPSDWEDPIVAEVHQIRREIMAEFDNDVDAYFRYVQSLEEEDRKRGMRYVDGTVKKVGVPEQTD